MNLPQLQSHIMNDDELTKHRAYIAIKAQALMSRFFQLPQDELVAREIICGWMDMLQDYTREEIDKAFKQYLIDSPRTRPHEGLIRKVIMDNRKMLVAMQPKKYIEQKPRSHPDADVRKRIAEEALSTFGKNHGI
jgi:hypothetical protein